MGTFLPLLLAATIGQQASPQGLPTKAGQMVRFEVMVADLAEAISEPTAAQILELEKTRKMKSLMRFQLTSLEEQPGFVQIGQTVPRVTGQVVGGRGGPGGFGPGGGGFGGAVPAAAMPRYSDVNVGTVMYVTPRIENDGSIAAKLTFFRTSLAEKKDGAADAEPVPLPQAVDRLTLETTLHLQAGEGQVVGVQQGGKESATTWIVITAHVGPPK